MDWPVGLDREEIVWKDHCGIEDWLPPKEHVHGLAVNRSLGYLVAEDDEFVTICQNQSSYNGNIEHSVTIAKALIVERNKLIPSTPRKKGKR